MDIVTYALVKKIAIGAVSGISDISFNDNNLVFSFKDGTSTSLAVPLPSDGKDGVSITNVVVDEYNHLICLFSDGTSVDAGEITGGSGGTTNYNKLLNTPITNIVGTTDEPIVLNTLDYGNYMLSGSFIYTSQDTDIKTINYKSIVQIYQDSVSSRKVAKFENFEDSKFYIYNIYFNDDETCLQDKILVTNQSAILFVKEADLPTQGTEGVLYVTESSLYQYTEDGYVNMGGPQWGSF